MEATSSKLGVKEAHVAREVVQVAKEFEMMVLGDAVRP